MYAVWFDFKNSIQNPIRSGIFNKKDLQTHPTSTNAYKNGSVCDFYLDWFGFEDS
jgi:hypothetical protein